MNERLLATRRFDLADQQAFADASGDVNPMHLDRLAARRTQAGVPVVHGVNAMLWALDTLLAVEPQAPLIALSAQFTRFVAMDEEVALWTKATAAGTRLEVRQGDVKLVSILARGKPGKTAALRLPPGEPTAVPATPAILSFAQAIGRAGTNMLVGGDALYPHVTARLGADRVRGLVALSTLVGMVAPGLHSIFSDLDVAFDDDEATAALAYQVAEAHDVFRLLGILVTGPGFAGKVQAFVRLPPVVQPTMAEMRAHVAAGSGAGVCALVVGGSRGLGEVTAKLLAASGARVAITYVAGRDDAEKVAAEIRDEGGDCVALRYDALSSAAPQLGALPFVPDHLYYFATRKIFLQKSDLFSPDVLADFTRVYVDGFADLCMHLAATHDLVAFYPSSVAIDERPRAMTEYTMAKAAAEILCADMTRFMPRIRTLVRRLPRLLTDQTATVTPAETPPAAEIMAEVVAAMLAIEVK